FAADQITRINVPWRGQTDTGHLPPYLVQQILAMGNQRVIGSTQDQGVAQAHSDPAGFPYPPGFDGQGTVSGSEFNGLPAVPIVTPGSDLGHAELQVVGGREGLN